MAYYYVKGTLGTCITTAGAFGTAQTGAFGSGNLTAGNVYATIPDVNTYNTLAHGDVICVSDVDDYNASAPITVNGARVTTAGISGAMCSTIISVDDLNADQYKAGAELDTSSTNNFNFDGNMTCYGFTFRSGDDIATGNIEGSFQRFVDCTFYMDGTVASYFGPDFYNLMEFVNCDFHFNDIDKRFQVLNFSSMRILGGTFTGAQDDMFYGGTGKELVEVVGADISNVTDYLVGIWGNNPKVDDGGIFVFRGCTLNSSLTGYHEEPFQHPQASILVTNCGPSTATKGELEYQYYYHAFGGTAEDETSKYRDGSTAYPGGQKTSFKVTIADNATIDRPFDFELPTRYAELSNAASDTVRVYFMSATALDGNDVWVTADWSHATNVYNDTLTATPNLFTSAASLSTNTESWTGRTTQNRYHIDVDMSSGGDCYPVLTLHVAKHSTTIYLDSELVVL